MKKQQIDFYGDKDNYIHLKFGDARKHYFLTNEFAKEYPLFAKEYTKYFAYDETSQFKNPFQIVHYAYKNAIPVHFYFNFTDTPAKSENEIMEYLGRETAFISELSKSNKIYILWSVISPKKSHIGI